MRWGFSKLLRNFSRKRDASSSSTRRPSLDRVTVIRCCVQRPSAASVSSALERPTARIHAWGGLITALKPLMPNIPRLEILRKGEKNKIKQDSNYSAVIYGKNILNVAVWVNQWAVTVAEFWKTNKSKKSGFDHKRGFFLFFLRLNKYVSPEFMFRGQQRNRKIT